MRKKIEGYGYSVKRKDKNYKKFKKQREVRGFDNTELWNLDVAIAKFIAPRLKAYILHKDTGVPQSLISDVGFPGANYTPYENSDDHNVILAQWNDKLQKMLGFFEFVASEKETTDRMPNDLKEGMKLFAEHYSDLWD